MPRPHDLDYNHVGFNERPHLMGSCEMCYLIKTGQLAKDSQLELLHRAVIVYLALPTNTSMETLHQRLRNLKFSGCRQGLPMLFLMREVLAHMHSRRLELRRLEQIIPQVIFSSASRGQPIKFRKKAFTVKEIAELARSAIMKALEGRLGLLNASQGNAGFEWAKNIDQEENGDELPTPAQSAVQNTARSERHPQLGVFTEKEERPRNRTRKRDALPVPAPGKRLATYAADPAESDPEAPDSHRLATHGDNRKPANRTRTVVNDLGKLARIVNGALEKQS